jgi:hypothetical protein
MKFIKNFRVFEKSADALSSEQIDLIELEHILIDFEQMGLDYDIKMGSSIVVDWNLFNDDKTGGPKCLNSGDIDKYTKSRTGNSLTIEFNTSELHTYNIDETSEAYEMLKDYLFDNYDLIPNYIYVNYHWSYMYFEDLDKIKENIPLNTERFLFDRSAKLGSKDPNIFKAQKLVLAFYKNWN